MACETRFLCPITFMFPDNHAVEFDTSEPYLPHYQTAR